MYSDIDVQKHVMEVFNIMHYKRLKAHHVNNKNNQVFH